MIPEGQRYDALVMYIITKKLDNKTLEAWKLSDKGNENQATSAQLSNFLEEYCRTMYLVHSSKTQENQINNKVERPFRKNVTNSFHTHLNSLCCAFCKKSHQLYKCFKFRKLTISERMQFVASNNVCSKCLSSSHSIGQCKSSYRCVKCEQPHHLLLHQFTDSNLTNQPQDSPSSTSAAVLPTIRTYVALRNERTALLATALVPVQSMHGEPIVLRALLDQGSEVTFITQAAAALLNLKLIKSSVIIKGIGSSSAGKSNHMVRLNMSSIYNPESRFAIDAIVLPTLTSLMPSKLIRAHFPHVDNLQLADPKYFETSKQISFLGRTFMMNSY